MYFKPLTKTSTEILAFLSSRIRESYTVRQIAEAIGKDYKITYTMTMRLIKQHYIKAEKKPPSTYCSLNLKGNASLLAYIEWVRGSRFLEKYKDIKIIAEDITSKISIPFFIPILFGSHVKGTASPKSDLDLLLIIPEQIFEREIEIAITSIQRISPLGIHETVLNYNEFLALLNQKKPNVAWEAVDNRIVPYGAEMLFKILEEVL